MESYSIEPSSSSAVFTHPAEKRPTWFCVDLRFVIAAVVVFGVVVATTIRFSHEVFDPLAVVRLLLSIGIVSIFYLLYFLHSERSREFFYGILYAYFHFVGLLWIFPYALATVCNRSWMTR